MKKPAAAQHSCCPLRLYQRSLVHARATRAVLRSSVWVGMLEDFARPGESSITFFSRTCWSSYRSKAEKLRLTLLEQQQKLLDTTR